MQRHTTCFVISKCVHSRHKRVQLRWKSRFLSLCCWILSAFFAHFTIHSWFQLKPVFRISATFAKSSIYQVLQTIFWWSFRSHCASVASVFVYLCALLLCPSLRCERTARIRRRWTSSHNSWFVFPWVSHHCGLHCHLVPLSGFHIHTHTQTVPQAKCRHRRCQLPKAVLLNMTLHLRAVGIHSISLQQRALQLLAWSELTELIELSCC